LQNEVGTCGLLVESFGSIDQGHYRDWREELLNQERKCQVASYDVEKHPPKSGLEHLSTEELLERLRNANHPPQPNKQGLDDYIHGQEENEDQADYGRDDTSRDRK